jgi:hypothetical protein
MRVLQEILAWSKELPDWQSDAIARLFVKEKLLEKDLDDLFALLKIEHGIPDSEGRKANRLLDAQVPKGANAADQIKLLEIKNLRNVNAIAENKILSFSHNGLTVIYGDNGSGKSGYSRVLKRVCRARDQNEPIHPNINRPANKANKTEATFKISINGEFQEITWQNGTPAPEILSFFAVFDSRCARNYIDSEGDYAYVPYGMDILEGLANACKELKVKVENEIVQNPVNKTTFADLSGF